MQLSGLTARELNPLLFRWKTHTERKCFASFPFAGIILFRFKGCNLSRIGGNY